MVVVEGVEDKSQSRPEKDAEEEDGLVGEKFVALVENEQKLGDDPQKEESYKDCDGDDDAKMHDRFHEHDAMVGRGGGA